jgi:pimeloyl-ACP methyl ester carboxylesterase
MAIELAIERISGETPTRAIAFLHGILGRGSNLRTIAREFVQQRPQWSAWLVDLRGHGRSAKGTPGPALESAARDIVALATREDLPLHAILGHSFGGKVALEAARIGEAGSLEHVVVVDSMPGAREPLQGGDSALAVIAAVESLPATFFSITDFTRALEAAGFKRELAQWLAGNLERAGNQVRFALDLHEIRALVFDYFARDLWPVVEHPPAATRVHLVIGDHSDAYSGAERDRASRIAASNERVTVDVLPTGHWVHVDDPDGLLRTMLHHLDESGNKPAYSRS